MAMKMSVDGNEIKMKLIRMEKFETQFLETE